MALCFLSKLNRDEYTRRNFEIPATGTVLVSECTDALRTLFKENEEAIFFKDAHDLISKVRLLLDDECMRISIAKAGYERIWASGYDIDATAVRFLETLNGK
jgi:spore maturation protein CgeB